MEEGELNKLDWTLGREELVNETKEVRGYSLGHFVQGV